MVDEINPNPPDKRALAGSALLLAAVVIAAGVVLEMMKPTIEIARTGATKARLHGQVQRAAGVSFDNDLDAAKRELSDPLLLGTTTPAIVWDLHRDAEVAGRVVRVVVPEGYNGDVTVMVGIGGDGRTTRVTVPEHGETPEFGGRLIAAGEILAQFIGYVAPTAEGGVTVGATHPALDGVSGATITATAIARGVQRAMILHQELGNVGLNGNVSE